jgi:1-deoxy-D-xylulose-5-phosphate reductoisomerase
MKGISIIGSTGSVGTQALDVLEHLPGRFRVAGLAAGNRVDDLADQIVRFRPDVVSVSGPAEASRLVQRLREMGAPHPEILYGEAGLEAVATAPGANLVLTSVVGILGLKPTLAAIASGKHIALANKETLVAAGELVMGAAEGAGVSIIPVDSEHSALFQCLVGEDSRALKRLILTASGGPFRGFKDLSGITKEQALKHPRWVMGAKVTIDSATLMNKALEMIEAKWLFNVPMEKVSVLVHPQSVIHSLVEFVDGNLMAQVGPTDMRLPIQYALTYPERVPGFMRPLDLVETGTLSFEYPDEETFPSLRYAKEAVNAGGTAPAVLNAANEVAVQRFLADDVPFASIFRIIQDVMEMYQPSAATDLAAILDADEWSRRAAASINGW